MKCTLWSKRTLYIPSVPVSQMKLPYRLLRTIRGNTHQSIDCLSFELQFPAPHTPGTDCTHTCSSLHPLHISTPLTFIPTKSWFAMVIISEHLLLWIVYSVMTWTVSRFCDSLLPAPTRICLLDCDSLPPALIFACIVNVSSRRYGCLSVLRCCLINCIWILNLLTPRYSQHIIAQRAKRQWIKPIDR